MRNPVSDVGDTARGIHYCKKQGLFKIESHKATDS